MTARRVDCCCFLKIRAMTRSYRRSSGITPLSLRRFSPLPHTGILIWGRTLAKYNQDACAVAYAYDGYIKAKLSVALEVLSDLKHVLKEDAGFSLNFDSTQKSKTKFLVKGISAAESHAVALRRAVFGRVTRVKV